MNLRILLAGWVMVLGLVSGLEAADLAVSWDPPAGNTDGSTIKDLAGYRFYYGTAPRTYSSTMDVGLATAAVISNAQPGQTFYFTASAYNSNGTESAFSEEWSWTLASASTSSPPNITQTDAKGIPPVVYLSLQGGLKLGIRGTVGADLQVQTSTNLIDSLGWEVHQTILLTNAASALNGVAAAPQNALDAAFVPAFEWLDLSPATSNVSQFFRVVMPYDYAVLANKVLTGKGYQTRLIVIRLAGETQHDVCYVGGDQAYIDCSDDLFVLALNYSGATIRQIADDYGNYAKMNWTSASEFAFSNGSRQLLSTVVKTDPPASDPPLAGIQTTGTAVNF